MALKTATASFKPRPAGFYWSLRRGRQTIIFHRDPGRWCGARALEHRSATFLRCPLTQAAWQLVKYQQFIRAGKPTLTFEPAVTIGYWHKNAVGEAFEAVAQDGTDEAADLRSYDGSLQKLDPEAWQAMYPETIEPPQRRGGFLDLPPVDVKNPEAWAETLDWMTELERQNRNPGCMQIALIIHARHSDHHWNTLSRSRATGNYMIYIL